ncbi:MAG: lactate utilization protein [Solidesulfovibrio sp. DCME]|jgi:L-lactate dehydrogenase complex protein LldG|uniref:LutC/YkgG family protein n=1 Tax=unclassified Solidesulfovibrio TaxID=2910989 RepID=UPI002B20D225|nr:lactate utilization protein [Solidesulfovibrio sp.]MEA4854878.1 lactate utilization protein [Solidesulfovibrio sp.]
MSTSPALVDRLTEKAGLVSAVVRTVASMDEALAYVAETCDAKEACQILASGCDAPLSGTAEALCATKQQKIVCAPDLPEDEVAKLTTLCEARGIAVITKGMRERLGGIDIALTMAAAGIAETGSIVVRSTDEEVRLATMIAETHIAVLPESTIVADSYDFEPTLVEWMGQAPNYTAFITGPSRTADIERVLALGVHGPLELHILILEGK